MKNTKPVGNAVRASVFVSGLVVLLSSGCGLCANEEMLRVPSPDAKLEAVIFQRDCGATTGFSTQVSIVPKGASLPNEGGNVFVADTDHGKTPGTSWGGPPIKLEWSSKLGLTVVTDPNARIFHREPKISVSTGLFRTEDVVVEYKSVSR